MRSRVRFRSSSPRSRRLTVWLETPAAAVIDVNLQGDTACPIADVLTKSGTPFVFATEYDDAAILDRSRDAPRCEKPASVLKIAQSLFSFSALVKPRQSADFCGAEFETRRLAATDASLSYAIVARSPGLLVTTRV